MDQRAIDLLSSTRNRYIVHSTSVPAGPDDENGEDDSGASGGKG